MGSRDPLNRNRILFIQPPSTMLRLQRLKSRRPALEAPLPFVYLAPYLLDAGFQVRVLDLRIDSIATLRRCLQNESPGIAGISVMPGSMLKDTIEVTRRIKQWSPGTRVVWGGTFPSLHHEICLQVDQLDFVVRGDGEITLLELASALRDGSGGADWDRIAGLAFMRGGAIVTSPDREPADLERQPIGAWGILDRYIEHYLGPLGQLSINTARGCPFSCTFCYNTALYRGFNRYRAKSIEASMEEIRFLQDRYQPRVLTFMDDDFLADRRRGIELLTSAHESFPSLKYCIDARVNELDDTDRVSQLSRLGVASAFFGVEAASQHVLEQVRKGCDTQEAFEAARNCATYGIAATYSFTCGYPDETTEDLIRRIEMAAMLRELHQAGRSQIEIISPVLGTPLFAELTRKQMVPHESVERWCHFSDWKSAREKRWIGDAKFYEAFQLAFYLAFSTQTRRDGSARLLTEMLSRWSRFRLIGRRPRGLLEYRAANALVKKLIWS
ncbi:MAG: hypothetical protein AMXMBFR13_44330 [Phycisphaerae bacterium]